MLDAGGSGALGQRHSGGGCRLRDLLDTYPKAVAVDCKNVAAVEKAMEPRRFFWCYQFCGARAAGLRRDLREVCLGVGSPLFVDPPLRHAE